MRIGMVWLAVSALTGAVQAGEWQWLFNGQSLDAWRGFKKEAPGAGWAIEDGGLTRVAAAGDLITREKYEDFELEFEWRVAPGGNSGVFYRVVEEEGLQHVFQSGPEYQILDDAAHKDGRKPETSAASNYALHAPVGAEPKPAGEWNYGRIVVNGDRVDHWLNGVRVVGYELGSADWLERVKNSKFASMPAYGKAREGHIALQDHGDRVSFRNIRVRRLESRTGPAVIRVGTDATFPPFHYLKDGQPTGHDVELARMAIAAAGREADVIVIRPYDELWRALDRGDVDLIAATTGETPDRAARYLLSRPYFPTCQAVMVRNQQGEPRDLAELAGRRVGAAGDGTSAQAVSKMPGVKAVRLEKGQAGVPALLKGEIDALVLDEFDAVEAARKQPDRLRVLPVGAAAESYHFVFRRSDQELCDLVNRGLGAVAKPELERMRRGMGVERGPDWPVDCP